MSADTTKQMKATGRVDSRALEAAKEAAATVLASEPRPGINPLIAIEPAIRAYLDNAQSNTRAALEAFCDPAKLREAVMMSGAHLSHDQAMRIIEEDRLGIAAALNPDGEKAS